MEKHNQLKFAMKKKKKKSNSLLTNQPLLLLLISFVMVTKEDPIVSLWRGRPRHLPLTPLTSSLSKMNEWGKHFNVIDFLNCSQLHLLSTSISSMVVVVKFEFCLKSFRWKCIRSEVIKYLSKYAESQKFKPCLQDCSY